jgi:hypothetical protein
MKMIALAIVVLAVFVSCDRKPSPLNSTSTPQASPSPERDRLVVDDSTTITVATDLQAVASLCKTSPNDRASLLLAAEMQRRTACGVDPTIQACRDATAVLTNTTLAIRRFESGTAQVLAMCLEQARQDAEQARQDDLARKAAQARLLKAARAAQARQKRVDRWNACWAWLGDSWATVSLEDLCQGLYHTIPAQDVPIDQCIAEAKACQDLLWKPAP